MVIYIYIYIIYWINVHVSIVRETLWPIVLNISFISRFFIARIFIQSRITMYHEGIKNQSSIALQDLRKPYPSTVRKCLSFLIIICTSNSLNCFSLYYSTVNFLLCVPLGAIVISYDIFVCWLPLVASPL